MRNRIVDLFAGLCARTPAALGLITLVALAGSASAGRARPTPPVTDGGGLPATPEPGAALAFALGVGVIAWAVRRSRKP
jgi:hypothetical protein